MEDWQNKVRDELAQARSARQKGNEGMARVCARRAAGIIIGEYLHQRGLTDPGPSAYDRLAIFQSLPDVDEQCKAVCNHFLIRVNQDHKLPLDADLISEVEWLARELLAYEGH